MTTILAEQSQLTLSAARADSDDLWLPASEAERASGWALKPEGFCKGDICVPMPPNRASEFSNGGDINVATLWRHMGMPLARDASGETWVLGAASSSRSTQLHSLAAPAFSLPDLAGVQHSLKSQRGRKVLLVSWASW